jgi:hypothetical protein
MMTRLPRAVAAAIARARACFHNQVTLFLEGAQHRFGHLYLAGTIFIFRMCPRDQPAGAENFFHVKN